MSANQTSGAELSFARELPLTRAAIAFASDRHRTQRRAGDGARFIAHPVEVAGLLERSQYPDHVVAAGVLHDVLEDTDAQRSELEARFGPQTARLVALVSDDPEIADEDARKAELRERVREGGPDALAVFAADKVSKVRELRMQMAAGLDPDVADAKIRQHGRSLAMLEQALPDRRLVDLLRFELESLERLPPDAGR